MWHSLSDIAHYNRLPKDAFIKFAKENRKKYGLDDKDMVSTWDSDELIDDFKKQYNKNESFVNEQDMVGDAAYAKDLLNVQAWYNTEMKRLNDMLAKKKNDAMVNYQKRVQTTTAQQKAAAAQQQTKTAPTTQQAAATGTVTTTGQPVNASGNPAAAKVESYSDPDILKINLINEDDETRVSQSMNPYGPDMRNWYQKPENKLGYVEPKKSPRPKKMSSKVQNQIWDIEGQIDDLKNEIRWTMERYESPSYEGAEGEIENFFGEVGSEAADILNSGAYKSDEEKAYALRELGIEQPEQIIKDYYYYYPEFDPTKEEERKEAEEKVKRIEAEIEQLETKLSQLEEMYESLNETEFNTEEVDPYELQDLKDYMDAESISYAEDVSGDSIDFDETELDREWNDRIEDMGFKEVVRNETETDDILTIDDEKPAEDFTEEDERIDEDKVFYVKVENEGEAFVGKIYKLFDEGDWRSKIVDGESETFEQLNYDPDWDEVDIVAFLRENYADAEIVSEEEFNDHVEEPEAEPEEEEVKESVNESKESRLELQKIFDYFMRVNVAKLDKNKEVNQMFLRGYEGKELPIYVNAATPNFVAWQAGHKRRSANEHQIPTLDDYLTESK